MVVDIEVITNFVAALFGDGIIKPLEVTDVKPVDVKLMVAPLTKFVLVAVRSVKAATPLTPFLEVVPPIVQLTSLAAARTAAVLVVVLPYWSCIATTGCVPKAAPFVAGKVGCVVIPSLVAAPTLMVCDTVAFAYPFAIIVILFGPELCSNVDREGVNVIFPEDTEYADEESVVPPTVTLVIAVRHVELSVNVTSNAASTLALGAAINAGADKYDTCPDT